jgi:hypothetical protein
MEKVAASHQDDHAKAVCQRVNDTAVAAGPCSTLTGSYR